MTMKPIELKFKRDTKLRRKFFTPKHFVHPAKMHLQMLLWIVGKYTKPGEIILDPMAGAGTTMLAALLDRNVVLVELEEKFCKMCADNWAKLVEDGRAIGWCQIIQGDARNLEGLLADKIITSPPYTNRMDGGAELQKGFKPYSGEATGWFTTRPQGNIGNLRYGDINNLKSQSYLEAMLQVYQQCFAVLKDGGLMILVTKNFIRNKQVVRLDVDTIQLCERAGFRLVDWHYRKLTSQSFLRVIYYKKYPEVEVIDKEDILVFVKRA